MAMRRASLAGARAPGKLARRRHDRCHHDEETSAKALHGQWREEPLCALAHAGARDDLDHEKIAAWDRPIAAHLATCAECQDREAWPPVARPRSTGGDLTALEGIDEPTALTIIRESGLDMGRWPTVQHCTSWRGRCPPHRGCGGQGGSRGTTPRANRGATALRLAAAGLQRRQSALGAFCRRMTARLGTPKAITATAHTLARLLDTLLKQGTASVRPRLADAAQPDRARMVQSLTRRAKALGDALVQTPAGTPP